VGIVGQKIGVFFDERAKGVEPSFQPWEGCIMPLYYARKPPTGGIFKFPNIRMFEININSLLGVSDNRAKNIG
jgi:hypothetical protein